ncbi:hypothetical protein ACUYOF_13915 [Photobacterium ganghwense]|uniref:hypothetical protein n=1 Tax=Photobacterium ganghwense TaxID=320778 RepID=UPI0040574F3C
MTESNHAACQVEGIKYFVIWEEARIGYFLDGIYYGKTGFPEVLGENYTLSEKYLIREDGTQFQIVCEDDKERLSRTRAANGGSI